MQQTGHVIATVITVTLAFVLTAFLAGLLDYKPSVDLPEEYKEMTFSTPIRGEYKNGRVEIEFDHNRNYEITLSDDSLRVVDPNSGRMIYSEATNWKNPIGLQKAIQKDNE